MVSMRRNFMFFKFKVVVTKNWVTGNKSFSMILKPEMILSAVSDKRENIIFFDRKFKIYEKYYF